MKNKLFGLFIILIIFLTSCAMPNFNDFYFDEVNFRKDSVTLWIKKENKYVSFKNNTIELKLANITQWVFNNIKYDYELVEAFKKNIFVYKQKTPMEVLMTKKGICADMSYLICAIANHQLNIQPSVSRLVGYNDQGVFDYKDKGHMVALYNDIFFDATIGGYENYLIYCEKANMKFIENISYNNIPGYMQRFYKGN